MAKNLVIVESPAKARTLQKYLGRDFQVKASVGHVMDLPKSKLGVDIEHDFAPEYQVLHGKKKIISELQGRGQGQGEHLPRARPGSRGRGDRLAHRRAPRQGAPEEHPPRAVQRDHQARGAGGHPQPAGARPQPVRGAADAPHPRSPGRLPDQPAALEEGAPRAVGRPRAVGGGAHHLRARARDPGLPGEGVLVDHRAARRAEPAAVLGAAVPHRRPTSSIRRSSASRTQAAADDAGRRACAARRGPSAKVERKERRRFPTPPFITSRLQQEASRKLGYAPEPHHAHRAAALRRHRAGRPRAPSA